MKTKRFIWPVILTGIIGVVSACSGKPADTQVEDDAGKKIEPVKVMSVQTRVVGRVVEYTSTLSGYEEVNMVPATPGRIDAVLVEVGSRVKKGDVLVRMDRTQLHQAQTQLRTLEADYQRLDTLRKIGSIAQQQYDQLKAQYDIARSNVAFLQENTVLVAPFNGIISGKYYENGEMFSGAPNTREGKAAIVSLVQVQPLKALVSVSEQFLPRLKPGIQAKIVTDVYADKEFSGKIFRVHPTIDPATRSFVVEIEVPNPSEMLRPGMFARVQIDMGEVEALLIPAIAVLKLQGSNERYVFIVSGNEAKRVGVQLGRRFDDMVELISGDVKPGDQLVIAGQSRLVDGSPVEISE
jgi:membrane fusion protein, multidrug efflux system